MKIMKLLYIYFDIPLQPWQIAQFRGALSEWVMTHKSDTLTEAEQALFHNHDGNGFHYRYPLIQYRSIKGKATLIVLNEAIKVLQKVLLDMDFPFVMRGKTMELRWEGMDMVKHELQMTESPQTYRLRNWIALNKERFEEWEDIRGLTKKAAMLEKALAGHLVAYAIGMDWRIPERFEVELLELRVWRQLPYHKVHLNAFDVVFQVPLLLPGGIGLGKATSHGFGALQKWRA